MNENFLEICDKYDGDLSTILILDSGVPIHKEFQDNIIQCGELKSNYLG